MIIKLESLLYENFAGKNFVCVDIQECYKDYFPFSMNEFSSFINENNKNFSNLTFLYNGELCGMNESDYKIWLIDNGIDEEIIDCADFYDKGYAYFRDCMDTGINEDYIINFVRFMYDNDVHDSRDMTRELWAKYLRMHRRTDRRELYDALKKESLLCYIPDLMTYLRGMRNIVLVGGSVDACLKEVEIALKALNLDYRVYSKFTY